MMSYLETNQNSQPQNPNPTGIWQSLWLKLISQALDEISQRRYVSAWQTLQLLRTQIPPECEQEVKKYYDAIEPIVNKQFRGNNLQEAQELRAHYIFLKMQTPLLELLSAIRTSLYEHNWINKDFTVRARITQGAQL